MSNEYVDDMCARPIRVQQATCAAHISDSLFLCANGEALQRAWPVKIFRFRFVSNNIDRQSSNLTNRKKTLVYYTGVILHFL